MPNPSILDQDRATGPGSQPNNESGRILSATSCPNSNSRTPISTEEGRKGLEGTVVAVTAESVLLDIGYKTEGIIPLAEFVNAGETVKRGDKLPVSSRAAIPRAITSFPASRSNGPKIGPSLEKAFADKASIAGVVTAVIKGGVSVDVGVRAFMPASRSGAKDAAEMEKLIGQEIRCRIIKLDVADEDVVVDRRAVLEEEERAPKSDATRRSRKARPSRAPSAALTDYGAFVDIGGVDALLHVADISWGRVNKPSDVLTVGAADRSQDSESGSRQAAHLAGHEAASAASLGRGRRKIQSRRAGAGHGVTRVTDFGAFVELEPGVEGLIHLSEMSWSKKARKPSDVVKPAIRSKW